MKIVSAEFVAAARAPAEIPTPRYPEIALAGRSNVGKSSLLNRLTARRKLARTSQTPGCTRGLMFFEINEELMLVDLPGYGWAKRSQTERDAWKNLVEYYLARRPALAGVIVLVDARRGPQDEELQLAQFLGTHGVATAWALTKCDKLPRAKLAEAVRTVREIFDGDDVIVTSAKTGTGITQIWSWIRRAAEGRLQ